jgi:hypothetical protein
LEEPKPLRVPYEQELNETALVFFRQVFVRIIKAGPYLVYENLAPDLVLV